MAIILFLSFLFTNYQAANLTKVNVTGDINMLIPSDFRPMTDDEIAKKYFTTKRPVALFTNQETTIDLGINRSVTNWSADDLEIMMSFQKSNIYSLYDEIEMISEGVKEVNGRKVAFFEFESTVKPEKNSFKQKGAINKYTYIQYVIVGEISWVFNFTSPSHLRQSWADTSKKIMDSVVIKGKK